MTREVRLHSEAGRELEETAAWYGEMHAGLGERFLRAVDTAIGDVVRWPEAGAVWRREPTEIRRAKVEGFPYRVVYLLTEDMVWVLAFAHERRRPGYWQDRAED